MKSPAKLYCDVCDFCLTLYETGFCVETHVVIVLGENIFTYLPEMQTHMAQTYGGQRKKGKSDGTKRGEKKVNDVPASVTF